MAKKRTTTTRKTKADVAAPRLNRFMVEQAIMNASLSRLQSLRKLLDERRDLDDECGYPKTDDITTAMYQLLYDREPIARRVVEVMPQETWKVQPTVYETEDQQQTTAFEEAWNSLDSQLNPDNWYESSEGSAIWEVLERADILSGIGSYGVLLIGVDDGKDLSEPIEVSSDLGLLYLKPYSENNASITAYETDKSNRRYGMPLSYSLTTTSGSVSSSVQVHWSRVIHIADNIRSSEVWGTPRMQPVYNRLYDLRKLYGGSAEMYWKGAFPGLSIETHPQLGGDVELPEDITTVMTNYMDGLQRYLALEGMTAKTLTPQVVDPSKQIEVQIDAICILLGIPKRVFVGSERGELASSQDAFTWESRLVHRQNSYVTPRVVVPLVNRLVQIGVLPEPTSYKVDWPSITKINAKDDAEIQAKRTQALAQYVASGADTVMAPIDFMTRILGFSEDEALQIQEASLGFLAEEEQVSADETTE